MTLDPGNQKGDVIDGGIGDGDGDGDGDGIPYYGTGMVVVMVIAMFIVSYKHGLVP